jgi:hypothetical protein
VGTLSPARDRGPPHLQSLKAIGGRVYLGYASGGYENLAARGSPHLFSFVLSYPLVGLVDVLTVKYINSVLKYKMF